jgi:hypothetical protein
LADFGPKALRDRVLRGGPEQAGAAYFDTPKPIIVKSNGAKQREWLFEAFSDNVWPP